MINRRSVIILLLISFILIAFVWPGFLYAQTKSKKRGVDITGVPIITYNTTHGAIIGANSMLFFHPSKSDSISPASVAGLGGGYSQDKSLFALLFTQLYLKENKWRVGVAGGIGDIKFQYFEAANESGAEGFVDYNTVSAFALVRVLRKIYGGFYGGVVMKLQHSKTDFENEPLVYEDVNANGIGFSGLFDHRDDVYYPRKGFYSAVNYLSNASWLGTDSVFNSLRATFNFYFRTNSEAVIATRIAAFSGFGNVPFTGQHAVGGKDIRGYTDGRYRANQVYSAQAEYRWAFAKRWGMVGFFGLALTVDPLSDLLPGGGVGIRYKTIIARGINIGIDGAVGKGDTGIYFRIGEAF